MCHNVPTPIKHNVPKFQVMGVGLESGGPNDMRLLAVTQESRPCNFIGKNCTFLIFSPFPKIFNF